MCRRWGLTDGPCRRLFESKPMTPEAMPIVLDWYGQLAAIIVGSFLYLAVVGALWRRVNAFQQPEPYWMFAGLVWPIVLPCLVGWWACGWLLEYMDAKDFGPPKN